MSEEQAGTVSFRSRQEPERKGVNVDAFVAHLADAARRRLLKVEPLAG